jgi:oxygen-independent coproporphyrinogen-3 oxidase
MLGLYVHIPFCVRKCAYCDFSSYEGLEAHVDDYVSALLAEAERVSEQVGARRLDTLYVGGGTPSVLTRAQVGTLLTGLRACFALRRDAEVTVEVNPDSLTAEKLAAFRKHGANRLSIGFQSLHDGHLRRLGRVHRARTALRSFSLAREAGFENISVDLMYAIPEQSLADWRRTIRRVTQLRPEHVSAYALTLEEGTPMQQDVAEGRVSLPSEDAVLAMADVGIELLEGAGYEHYEVSNFALPGRRSRHNQMYWRMEDCIGLGAGAHGYLDGCRWGNVGDPLEYMKRVRAGDDPAAFRETLPPKKALGEALMLGLRMREGVELLQLQERFGIDPREHYEKELEDLQRLGLIELSDKRLRVRRAGLHLLDEVALRLV